MSVGARECSLLSFYHGDRAERNQLGHSSLTGLASAGAGMQRKPVGWRRMAEPTLQRPPLTPPGCAVWLFKETC